MTYGLDTSVLMRLLNRTDDPYVQGVFNRINTMIADGDDFIISDLVASEIYYALQHHYGFSKENAINAMRAIAAAPGFSFSKEAEAALATPEAWKASPGLVDRMIANGYASHGHKTLSCERDFRKLDFTEVLS